MICKKKTRNEIETKMADFGKGKMRERNIGKITDFGREELEMIFTSGRSNRNGNR